MRIRLLLALLAFLYTGCAPSPGEEVRARDGVLDLRHADLNRPLVLAGEWKAHATVDAFPLNGFDLEDADWNAVDLPGLFTQQGFPDEGMVWYRLKILLPDQDVALSGYLKYARNASELYGAIPGREPVLLGRSGRPSDVAERSIQSRRPLAFNLPRDSTIQLSWKVSNHDYQRGGVPHSIVIGRADAMHRLLFRDELDTLLVGGIYLMLTFFFGGYWLWNRRDSAALMVSALTFVTMMRAVVVEGYVELFLGDAVSFHTRIVIEAITFFLLPGLTLMTLWSLYPKEYLPLRIGRFSWNPAPFFDEPELTRTDSQGKPPLARAWLRLNSTVLYVLVLFGGAFSLVSIFAHTSVITHLLTAFRLITLSMVLLTPFALFQIVERRRPMARITLTAFLIVLLATVHDILLSQGVINGGIFVAPYGLMAFLLLLGYIVARRNARNAHIVRHHAHILKAEVDRQTKDLKQAIVASEAANVAKTQFLNAVSHEIRTPLTSIIGFTQILEEELAHKATQQDLEFVHLIRDSGDRLLRLVNDLLDLAKIETGRLDLHIRDVALESVVYDVVRQLYPMARSKTLTLTASPGIRSYTVRADAMRLHQVLLNLVTNGLKFTDQGGVTISAAPASLAGADEQGRSAVALRIADTGSGMSREFLPHVFDRFTQELRSSATAVRGTGLGLALTRELTLRMNGRIEVESELGKGSVFTVVLPLASADSEHGAPNAQPAASTEVAGSSGDGGLAAGLPNPPAMAAPKGT